MKQLSAAPLVRDVGASTLQNKHGLLYHPFVCIFKTTHF